MPASIYTPELASAIIERVAAGEPLAQVCRDDGMPGVSTFYEWLARDEELSGRFARARVAGFDIIATDALRIADTPEPGEETRETDKGVEVRRGDMLGHRRLQVDTRLKLLAKWDPKRYGDRYLHDVGGQPGNPIQTSDVSVAVNPDSLSADEREALLKVIHKRLQGAG